jgi:hypothetical protein
MGGDDMKADKLATSLYDAIIGKKQQDIDRIIASIDAKDKDLLKVFNTKDFYDDGYRWHILNAAQSYRPNVMITLLKKGVDPNVQDEEGCTPLHRAIAIVKDVKIEDEEDFLANDECDDALYCVKLLLDHGADPNIRDNNGNTPVHILASNMYKGINKNYKLTGLRFLLQSGADLEIVNSQELTATNIMKNPINGDGILVSSSDATKEAWQKTLTTYYYDEIMKNSLWIAAIISTASLALGIAQHLNYITLGMSNTNLLLYTGLALSVTMLLTGALVLYTKAEIDCSIKASNCEELAQSKWDEFRGNIGL